jgi:hypothetical protein
LTPHKNTNLVKDKSQQNQENQIKEEFGRENKISFKGSQQSFGAWH